MNPPLIQLDALASAQLSQPRQDFPGYDLYRVSKIQSRGPTGYGAPDSASLLANRNYRAQGRDSSLDLMKQPQARSRSYDPKLNLKVCSYMRLEDFKRVNIELGDVTVSDAQGRPCYRLKLGGFLRRNSTLYFPLENFRSTLSNHIISRDGAPFRSPLNCSILEEDGGRLHLDVRPRMLPAFLEELTISVDCGYIVLRLRSSRDFLLLESIAFYVHTMRHDRSSALELVYKSKSSVSSPLFIMPIGYKYECLNRIVLMGIPLGNTSTQLYLERFELQRLSSAVSQRRKLGIPESELQLNRIKTETLDDIRLSDDQDKSFLVRQSRSASVPSGKYSTYTLDTR